MIEVTDEMVEAGLKAATDTVDPHSPEQYRYMFDDTDFRYMHAALTAALAVAPLPVCDTVNGIAVRDSGWVDRIGRGPK